ncbi:hypothetical protein LGM65_00675 [Burkholderia anthina]|uniref:hypothetical protein n=1 Tax=Burkholderia anthina TaxID=179879 RepID=UPI001CF39D29|nr:hypothetical protein [Burkholderia anthina]MCA8089408.1 hypothetical protein [Burkholderia anthina]
MASLLVIHVNGPINGGKTTIGRALARVLPEAVAASDRGTRTLTDWERQRIAEMYREGYAARAFSDCFADTSSASADACAEEIARRAALPAA